MNQHRTPMPRYVEPYRQSEPMYLSARTGLEIEKKSDHVFTSFYFVFTIKKKIHDAQIVDMSKL